MSQRIPTVRLIPLNGSAGAFTVIRCSIVCGYMEIEEDSAVPAQGLQGNFLDPFTAAPNPAVGVEVWLPSGANYPKGDYPIAIGDPRHNVAGRMLPIGNGGSGGYVDTRSPVPQTVPAGPGALNPSLGTPVMQLRSNTATPTQVRVREWV